MFISQEIGFGLVSFQMIFIIWDIQIRLSFAQVKIPELNLDHKNSLILEICFALNLVKYFLFQFDGLAQFPDCTPRRLITIRFVELAKI